MSLMVRAQSSGPTSLIPAIRNELAAIDKDQPIHSFKPLDQSVTELGADRRFSTWLLGAFAALAVALAANGEISHFHLPSAIGAPLIGSLSPDGSMIVLRSHLQAEPEQPLWIVPTLGGNARRLLGLA